MPPPHTPQDPLYTFDFDGVICDSAIETSITGWKAATTLWQDMTSPLPPQVAIDNFRIVRPQLETGYEAILIMRLLHLGKSANKICNNYSFLINHLIRQDSLQTDQLKTLFGRTRDDWIEDNDVEWLSMNPLFSGVAEKLQILIDTNNGDSHPWYIITTKQERFVKHILQANHIKVSGDQLFGMDQHKSKQETLLMLQDKYPNHSIVFVEDRLQTLLDIRDNPRLHSIKLQLVSWGFNTQEEREVAEESGIEVIDNYR
ncbi:MAG TPA: HAD family hydrolase [Thiothrix sp.]|nr:HAD family hydrolase [Thiothrix sp.]